jgi:outer membrane protein assembly factor BamB
VTSAYGMGSMMLAVSPDGAHRLWTNKKAGSKFQGAVLDNGLLYLNSEGRLMCLKWSDGVTQWQRADLGLGDHGPFVRVGDKLLCLSTSGELILLRAGSAGADTLARAQAVSGERIWSTPLLYGGRIYVKGVKELVCFDAPRVAPATRPTTGTARQVQRRNEPLASRLGSNQN